MRLDLSKKLKEALEQPLTWYNEREKREQLLLLASGGVAVFIGFYTIFEFVVGTFADQNKRYAELEESLERLSPLLNRYNVLKQKRALVESRFKKSNTSPASYAYLEGLIKRKAQVASRFEIRRGTESDIEDKYKIVPFTVRFQQMSSQELSDFLKELSADVERPSIISRLSVKTRGSKLSVEITLDFISQTQVA